jgi:glutathione synthase/RimK-type ligase-like ATP-grasp enzyme
VPKEEWVVQKRVQGEDGDAVTWNHHTGGTFITVVDRGQRVFQDALENSEKVLGRLGLDFGGVDFIVGGDRKVYFIEINTAVGCSGLSDAIYIDAFERLMEKEVGDV